MLCVTLTDLEEESLAAARRADLAELRLDHIGPERLEELARGEFAGGIFTLRRHSDGGARAISEGRYPGVSSKSSTLSPLGARGGEG